jgi:phenylpropionate dioxygenase-like ring-hydroxylating dioxygenase large terminal subunit
MHPFPSGWFRIGAGSELQPGGVKPLRYFGKDLVLFRGGDGKAHVLDAHCPHVGAHLGHGGRVKGNIIECPLHGWKWNGEGRCEGIPYTDKVPPNTIIRPWRVHEVNGQIMLWHDADGGEPAWEFPQMPEYDNPRWLPFRLAHRWIIRTHIQEFGENGMDIAHFPYLHDQQTASVESHGLETDGPFLVHHMFQHYNVFGLIKLFTPDVKGPLDIHLCGLGFAVNRAVIQTKIQMRYAFAFFFTPIDDERTEVYSMLSMEKTFGRILTYMLLRKASREGGVTINQDVPIWENKLCRPQPRLAEGDGPIMAYRRWASQFYPKEISCTPASL